MSYALRIAMAGGVFFGIQVWEGLRARRTHDKYLLEKANPTGTTLSLPEVRRSGVSLLLLFWEENEPRTRRRSTTGHRARGARATNRLAGHACASRGAGGRRGRPRAQRRRASLRLAHRATFVLSPPLPLPLSQYMDEKKKVVGGTPALLNVRAFGMEHLNVSLEACVGVHSSSSRDLPPSSPSPTLPPDSPLAGFEVASQSPHMTAGCCKVVAGY
jgi:hypothetical protein